MLKPTYTPTRELVNLDGVWRFAIDTRLPEQPWLARLDTPLEAAVPASYNDLFADPEIRDHVGWVWYQREVRVPRGWARRRGPAALRRGDPRRARLRRRPARRRAHRRLHAVRGRPHRCRAGRRRVPPDRRGQRRSHERDDPARQDRGRHGRPPSPDLLPRLLQLRGPRPVGLALQQAAHPRRRRHGGHRPRRRRPDRRLPRGDDRARPSVRVRLADDDGRPSSPRARARPAL